MDLVREWFIETDIEWKEIKKDVIDLNSKASLSDEFSKGIKDEVQTIFNLLECMTTGLLDGENFTFEQDSTILTREVHKALAENFSACNIKDDKYNKSKNDDKLDEKMKLKEFRRVWR